MNIIHRDIKPSNIMFGLNDHVKFIDFGIAVVMNKDNFGLMQVHGTPAFVAPEVFTGKFNKQSDVWSLGCTLYFIVYGQMPFKADNLDDLRDLINKGEFDMPEGISMNLRDFIASMIEVNVEKRITIEEALDHPWIHLGMDTSEEYQMS